MKLYLSSYHLGNDPKNLANLFYKNKNVAVIANAMDFLSENERLESVNEEISDMRSIDLLPEEIDLRDYFDKSSLLKNKLNSFGGLWIRGGNVFILRKAMKYSGLDKIIKEKTTDKNFVYAGYSAGICVLAPTLHGLELVDQSDSVPNKYKREIIWEGLSLADYALIPHYRSDHPESESVEQVVEYYTNRNMPYKTLSDGETIVTTI